MKKRQIPHTYAIIFYIILFCAALTWIIPGGQYKESINAAGEKTVVYEAVEHVPQTWQVFSAFYKGFVDKADIIVFILIIGGAFWIVNDSKAFDIGTVSFLGRARKMENNRFLRKIGVENFLLTSIMLLFSIFGAVFGMSEETIACRCDTEPIYNRHCARAGRYSALFRNRIPDILLDCHQYDRFLLDTALCC